MEPGTLSSQLSNHALRIDAVPTIRVALPHFRRVGSRLLRMPQRHQTTLHLPIALQSRPKAQYKETGLREMGWNGEGGGDSDITDQKCVDMPSLA